MPQVWTEHKAEEFATMVRLDEQRDPRLEGKPVSLTETRFALSRRHAYREPVRDETGLLLDLVLVRRRAGAYLWRCRLEPALARMLRHPMIVRRVLIAWDKRPL